ncbi:DUF6287 domain-containing protein [Streptococcus sp. A34]|uniref:DUF6287 domain-containing protein n=1 Tax=Streptococcus suis TaxID=1307 RepID=A0A3R8REW7_STRSU|nr:DUF6287 domain-containing protein [Streptococcus suis]RRR53560.1 hypothetical protein EI998_04665 [Streptococcus suis]UUM56944.1 DUF6287 domain-containing protein [Streptococcus suis]
MKKHFLLGLVCLMTLSACAQSNIPAETENSSSTSQESSTSSSELKIDDKELYQAVFADYQKIVEFAATADSSNVDGVLTVLNELQFPMNSWVVESAINTSDSIRYAFYDFNNDGQNELFFGSENPDGSMFVTGFYGIIADQVSLLAEGFVAGHGGARSALVLFQGGEYVSYGWYSGTGEAVGTLNRIDEMGQLIEGTPIDFHMRDELVSVFGKTESDILNPNQFDWEEFEIDRTETETSSSDQTDGVQSMNLEQIQAGNFASLEGEWVNARGDRMEIDSQGNVSYNDGQFVGFIDLKYHKVEGAILIVSITDPNGRASASVPTLLIPKGVQNTYGFLEGHSDQTDTSKDRMFSTQSVTTTEDFSKGVFYRVDD